jgi:hypothetical protein
MKKKSRKSDLYTYYWGLIDRALKELGIAKPHLKEAKNELHEALKTYMDIDSISGLTDNKENRYQLWLYANKASMIMARELGLGGGEVKL